MPKPTRSFEYRDPSIWKLIFRPWRRDPVTGEVLWARRFGYRAWPIWVRIDNSNARHDQ